MKKMLDLHIGNCGYEKNARFAYWKLKCAVSAQETAHFFTLLFRPAYKKSSEVVELQSF